MNPATRQSVLQHLAAGKPDEARRLLLQVLQRTPGDADANNLMAIAQTRLGLADQALMYARKAALAAPNAASLRANLANMLLMADRGEEALPEFQAAMRLDPSNPVPVTGLVAALTGLRRFVEASEVGMEALLRHPEHLPLSLEVGGAFLNCGRASDAVRVLEAAQGRAPGQPILQIRKAAAMLYDPAFGPVEVAEAHREVGRIIEPHISRYEATRVGRRVGSRVRLGVLSSDLRSHPVAHFVMPLLEHLDRERFEVVCYHDAGVSDMTTQRVKSFSNQWVETSRLSDDELADRIRTDDLDILLELSGFTSRPRPVTLAFKPTPVIVSWLGYPSTLGLSSVDARVVDSLTDPPGTAEPLHTEKLLRIDPCFLCYTPRLTPVPRTARDHVVFGSFNTFQKVNDPFLRLWGRVLAAVPGSRLLLKSGGLEEPGLQAQVRERAAAVGLDPSRVELIGYVRTPEEHLAAYGQVDIALDTFPYHGTTTTCEALSMGVPVISLVGGAHVSRVGLSLLSAVGHPEWCVDSEDAYVAAAASLALDRSRLSELRAALPGQLRASALCDGPAFAARFGAALESLLPSRRD